MRRRLIALVALAMLATAAPIQTVDPNAKHAPMTLTVWSNFTAREYNVSSAAVKLVQQKYPWMTIKHVGGKDDQAIQRAISGGNPPDVAVSFTPDNAARYCQTGAWQNL